MVVIILIIFSSVGVIEPR